jgi:hypothetical protein
MFTIVGKPPLKFHRFDFGFDDRCVPFSLNSCIVKFEFHFSVGWVRSLDACLSRMKLTTNLFHISLPLRHDLLPYLSLIPQGS